MCAANDLVSNFINTLPIFKRWNLLDKKVLADADGQKFATSDSTIQSRYSKKYLGKGRGISLYTLIANFVAVNARNIGLNEYEGHCLYDMVYGNKTDIDIDSVTGDNHSLNKLNFVALDAIDVDYVPSIKNVRGGLRRPLCPETRRACRVPAATCRNHQSGFDQITKQRDTARLAIVDTARKYSEPPYPKAKLSCDRLQVEISLI